MNFFPKLTLSVLCLILTAFVIAKGNACLQSQKTLQQTEPADDRSARLFSEYEKAMMENIALQIKVQKQQVDIQDEVKTRQDEISKASQFQQISTNLIKDIAAAAMDSNGKVKNQNLKNLLGPGGITIKVNPSPAPSPEK